MNHAFATSQRVLTFDLVDATLREINERRFKGVFEIEAGSDVWWEIKLPPDGWPYRLTVSLETKRKVEFRKSPGEFGSWMQMIFQEEIAKKFKGRCSNEGGRDSWDPEPEKYPTFKSWWEAVNFAHYRKKPLSKAERTFLGSLFEKQVAMFPENLKQFVPMSETP